MNNIFKKNCQGQSIIEAIIAIFIFSIIAFSFVGFILGGIDSEEKSRDIYLANGYLDEAIEALLSLKTYSWNVFDIDRSAISSSQKWVLAGEGTTEQLGKFRRYLNFYDVFRDSGFHIVPSTSPSAILDPLSKRAEVVVSWDIANSRTVSLDRSIVIANWNSDLWLQDNWTGGGGQSIWSDSTKYYAGGVEIDDTNAALKLAQTATSTYAAHGELVSSAYFAEGGISFSYLSWEESIPPQCSLCSVKIQVKTAPDSGGTSSSWSSSWSGPDGEDGDETDFYASSSRSFISADHDGDEWIKYKIIIDGDGSSTPAVDKISIYFQK